MHIFVEQNDKKWTQKWVKTNREKEKEEERRYLNHKQIVPSKSYLFQR